MLEGLSKIGNKFAAHGSTLPMIMECRLEGQQCLVLTWNALYSS